MISRTHFVIGIIAAALAIPIDSGGIAAASTSTSIHNLDGAPPSPYACHLSTHGQSGDCIDQVAATNDSRNNTFSCPADYPYVFLAAFSRDPLWEDFSRGTHYGDIAWAAVEQVEYTTQEAREKNHSYEGEMGRSWLNEKDRLGWVYFDWNAIHFGKGGVNWAAKFVCADTPAIW